MTTLEALFGIALFTALLTALALLVQVARSHLAPRGSIDITVNETRRMSVRAGTALLNALADADILLPAACGGTGSCGLCRVRVLAAGGPVTPVEGAHLTRAERSGGVRLACQVRARDGLRVDVPAEAFGVNEWTCRVRRVRSLTPLIRELVLSLPEGEELEFRAGAFVQVTSRPHEVRLGELQAATDFPEAWTRLGVSQVVARADAPASRAYSLANHPGEPGIVMLDVRLALPPPSAPAAPPGIVSTWLFSLREGDEVLVQGPHGHFFIEEGEGELVLVGGGVGMAPLRAHVLDQLLCRGSRRRISFWYGARSRADLFYVEELDRLAAAHENFSWCAALSEPAVGDAWDGATGFIHQVVHDEYLAGHPAPEDCTYYLCGPPMMIRATLGMLEALGVERDSIHHDDFGGSAAPESPPGRKKP